MVTVWAWAWGVSPACALHTSTTTAAPRRRQTDRSPPRRQDGSSKPGSGSARGKSAQGRADERGLLHSGFCTRQALRLILDAPAPRRLLRAAPAAPSLRRRPPLRTTRSAAPHGRLVLHRTQITLDERTHRAPCRRRQSAFVSVSIPCSVLLSSCDPICLQPPRFPSDATSPLLPLTLSPPCISSYFSFAPSRSAPRLSLRLPSPLRSTCVLTTLIRPTLRRPPSQRAPLTRASSFLRPRRPMPSRP